MTPHLYCKWGVLSLQSTFNTATKRFPWDNNPGELILEEFFAADGFQLLRKECTVSIVQRIC